MNVLPARSGCSTAADRSRDRRRLRPTRSRVRLAIREKTQPEDWSTFNTRSTLGGSLLGQKRYAAAEQLLPARVSRRQSYDLRWRVQLDREAALATAWANRT